MKRIIILFFTVVLAFSAYSQTLKEGDDCLADGKYDCAITNYSAVLDFASGKDKMKADFKLKIAQQCALHIKIADQKFADKDYNAAKENYQKILADSLNPKDPHAKLRLEECNNFLATASIQEGKSCFEKGIYACAEVKYGEALNLASGENKLTIEKELDKAKLCFESINAADQDFDKEYYRAAKENYQIVLDSNPQDAYAKSRLEKCNAFLATLSVSKEALSFPSSGGDESITVAFTNVDSYSVNALPSWCSVQKNTEGFVIACEANFTTELRTDYFTVTAGNKTEKIKVEQTGKETTLTTSSQNLHFTAYGGGSKLIEVKTNARDYQIGALPSWCKVSKSSDGFTLSCDVNKTDRSRSGSFKVNAGGKEVNIHVSQAKIRPPFNYPKTHDTWGLTLGVAGYSGYSQETFEDISLGGIQIGLRVEPLFKYGFGLNTGLLLEAYTKTIYSDDEYYDSDPEFDLSILNIPLHFEYRLNFSKWFNMFFYGGFGFNAIFSSESEDLGLSATSEYGGGFRISHVQFNIGGSSHLSNFKNMQYFGDLKTLPKVMISLSYMF